MPNVGGCPDEFDSSFEYHEGDTVEVDGIVLKCKSWPNSLYCSLSGFEPLGRYSDMAWTKMGYCQGTIVSLIPDISIASTCMKPQLLFSVVINEMSLKAPTPPSNIPCPEEYTPSSRYGAGDKVSVFLDIDRAVIYQCSQDIHNAKSALNTSPGIGPTLDGL